jgi:hypothetical protein
LCGRDREARTRRRNSGECRLSSMLFLACTESEVWWMGEVTTGVQAGTGNVKGLCRSGTLGLCVGRKGFSTECLSGADKVERAKTFVRVCVQRWRNSRNSRYGQINGHSPALAVLARDRTFPGSGGTAASVSRFHFSLMRISPGADIQYHLCSDGRARLFVLLILFRCHC